MAISSLSESLAADGSTSELQWPGGPGTAAVFGSFGGGTFTTEVSYDEGATFFEVGTDTTFTANGHGNFNLPSDVLLRITASSSTTPDVTAEIRPRAVRQTVR